MQGKNSEYESLRLGEGNDEFIHLRSKAIYKSSTSRCIEGEGEREAKRKRHARAVFYGVGYCPNVQLFNFLISELTP